jgi:hypothetical protein
MSKNGIVKYKTQTRAFEILSFGEYINQVFDEIALLNITSAVLIIGNVAFVNTQA